MLRRKARLRKEYLYRKAQELQQSHLHEKKKTINKALNEGRILPTELRKDEIALRKDLKFDQDDISPLTHVDDEYAKAGTYDPKICITTSHEPSQRLQQFAKEVRLMLPNAQVINRGGYTIKDLVDTCRKNDVTDLVFVHENRGQPTELIVSHLPFGPTAHFSLYNVVLRHDIPDRATVSEQYPHLLMDNFNTKIGERIKNILKYLFPVPKEDSKRVLTFSNSSDYISFRHHVFQKTGKEVHLVEVGPRFELRPYLIRQGTIEQDEADVEWALHPYMRTAKKRTML